MKTVNKVAVNTIVQYIQLIINVIISLITVRLVLSALGKVDYGIYSLVGGVIALISFISSSISQTSIRFISVSLGGGEMNKVRETFSICFSLHLYMAITLVIVFEIVGFFIFDSFLNIPEERVIAAKMVYQCMIINVFISIVNSPFIALISAQENFVFASFVGILNAFLKLAIAFLITVYQSDKLILYSILLSGVAIIDMLFYQIYSWKKYPNCISLKLVGFKPLRNVTSFAGWTLFDTFGSMVTNQGYAILYNKFFGPVMNTTYGLSQQVGGQLFNISRVVVVTMKPQIMKSYGGGDLKRSLRLSMTAGKIGFSMMALIAIPLIVMMPDVLDIWLKKENVPELTVFFTRIIILDIMIEQLTSGLVYSNQAIGNIKWFSIIVSTIRMLAIPASLICFMYGMPATYGVVMCLIFEGAASISRIFIMHKIAGLDTMDFFRTVIVKIFLPFSLTFISCWMMYKYWKGLFAMAIITIICACLYATCLYLVGLTTEERISVSSIISSFKNRYFKS